MCLKDLFLHIRNTISNFKKQFYIVKTKVGNYHNFTFVPY